MSLVDEDGWSHLRVVDDVNFPSPHIPIPSTAHPHSIHITSSHPNPTHHHPSTSHPPPIRRGRPPPTPCLRLQMMVVHMGSAAKASLVCPVVNPILLLLQLAGIHFQAFEALQARSRRASPRSRQIPPRPTESRSDPPRSHQIPPRLTESRSDPARSHLESRQIPPLGLHVNSGVSLRADHAVWRRLLLRRAVGVGGYSSPAASIADRSSARRCSYPLCSNGCPHGIRGLFWIHTGSGLLGSKRDPMAIHRAKLGLSAHVSAPPPSDESPHRAWPFRRSAAPSSLSSSSPSPPWSPPSPPSYSLRYRPTPRGSPMTRWV